MDKPTAQTESKSPTATPKKVKKKATSKVKDAGSDPGATKKVKSSKTKKKDGKSSKNELDKKKVKKKKKKVKEDQTKTTSSDEAKSKESTAEQENPEEKPKKVKKERKTVPVSCGCCKTLLLVPKGKTKFTCVCDVINYTDRSMDDELKELYEKYDWKEFIQKVPCPRCNEDTWIPKKALFFTCMECNSINDSRGKRLGVVRKGSQSHSAVVGLTKLTLTTPWLFWPFFFKDAITD